MHSAPPGHDRSLPYIRAVGRALPAHYATQEQLIAALREVWATRHFNLDRLEELHRNVQVKGRYLALPVDAYPGLATFQQRNDAWIRESTLLGEQVVRQALERAELTARDVDHVFFVTVTGIATPSVEARLANLLRFREDFKRTPIFGLGCVAGAAGLARAADYLRAFPSHTALLVSVELCSLTLQREDLSIPNIIASGLFGDGAACAVLSGAEVPGAKGPRVVASRSVFYPDTERIMGWDVVDSGFKVILSAKVPQLVKDHVRRNVEDFLVEQGLRRSDIRHWVAHTGGPRVLQAFEEALELESSALSRSWASLQEVGNLSSSSVLFVLGETLEQAGARPGDWGLMLAMGPGFCAEMVLLRW
ncbi:type III polyketide synthase [Myxococcus sp. K15C18031901]|uniref:type III polyketide synthase n=1 Tax=Myxococcus dinghuensis TaxID=2906761 RepID=UPI0020A8105C|nr:3-oxoacyl-[acyl-carrier-protein] synthase III C-terminal domain-containing protein [Myxococcus dinghuensis]MCP3100641.1 type III polyketide synthase [Myxococcus dinghuensis]